MLRVRWSSVVRETAGEETWHTDAAWNMSEMAHECYSVAGHSNHDVDMSNEITAHHKTPHQRANKARRNRFVNRCAFALPNHTRLVTIIYDTMHATPKSEQEKSRSLCRLTNAYYPLHHISMKEKRKSAMYTIPVPNSWV